jgi:hypothetical protein
MDLYFDVKFRRSVFVMFICTSVSALNRAKIWPIYVRCYKYYTTRISTKFSTRCSDTVFMRLSYVFTHLFASIFGPL